MYKNAVKKIVCLALVLILVVGFVVFLLPVSFSAYKSDHLFADFWLIVSDSGVKAGSILSTLIAGLILGCSRDSLQKGITTFLVFSLSVLIILKLASDFNELGLKRYIGHPRPSVEHLEDLGIVSTDSVYNKAELSERSAYIRSMLEGKQETVSHFNQDVLAHWVHSIGHSFPSGHAQNAFLLGSILSMALVGSRFGILKRLFFLPLFWAFLVAVSRVALGVHRPVDVTVGALIGSIEALLVFQIPFLKRLFEFDNPA